MNVPTPTQIDRQWRMRVPLGVELNEAPDTGTFVKCAGSCGQMIQYRSASHVYHSDPGRIIPCSHYVCVPCWELYFQGLIRLHDCRWVYAT